MVLTISKKLLLSFLGLTLLVLVATLGLARWSFERGFMDYANAVEQVRLEALAARLSEEYSANGKDWSPLTEPRFESLVRSAVPMGPRFEPPRPRPQRDGPGPRPGPPETALFNADGVQIAGPLLDETAATLLIVPVLMGNAQIGDVRCAPRRHFDSPQETAFSRQQLLTSVLTGLVSLGLALLVSLGLIRVLLAPIKRMFEGVTALADGKYDHRLNEVRGDELGQLMHKLDLLAERLEENRHSRKRWLADISHELRTPLTVLTGEIEALKDGIRPLDMNQVHSLDQEVARLRHLIDDLYDLSVSDIGGLRYEFGPVEAIEAVEAAVDSTRALAMARGLEISVSGPAGVLVNVDARRLDQLLLNLLKNSVAYTDAPGRIEISVEAIDSTVCIRIEDTLPGIPLEECERLFEPLYRPDDSRSRRTSGAGLGLAICRNIVNAHQGQITAAPSKLGGLQVRVELPMWSAS